MIVFDLVCTEGNHVFEAWFGSTNDYEEQRARGLVSCPVCSDSDIGKAVMAPRVGAKGNQAMVVSASDGSEQAIDPKALIKALAAAQAQLLEGSDYVGPRFAEEARAIHLGESDARSIYGQANRAEVKALIDEGIGVAPLPLPVRPPRTDN